MEENADWSMILVVDHFHSYFKHNPVAVVAHYTPKQFALKEECPFDFQLDLASLKFSWLR
jgi:hypothetical protein